MTFGKISIKWHLANVSTESLFLEILWPHLTSPTLLTTLKCSREIFLIYGPFQDSQIYTENCYLKKYITEQQKRQHSSKLYKSRHQASPHHICSTWAIQSSCGSPNKWNRRCTLCCYLSVLMVSLTCLPCLTSVREICLTMQRLEMPWFVDTPWRYKRS